MSKNKGFTLVEVLAAIVILGILSTIGIVSITNLRANQAKKFYETQYNLFVETAKTYFSDNKSKLPTVSGTTNSVYLEDLINENYIDSLLDYDKKSYQKDTSYVTVTKVGSEYAYSAALYPEGKTADTPEQPKDENPSNIKFSNYRKDNIKKGKDLKKGDIFYTNRTAKVNMTIEDSDGIKAFHYVIYKNNRKVYTGTFINPNENTASDVITLDTNNYEDGTYQIEVIVYDRAECVTSGRSEKIMIDRVAPKCITKSILDKLTIKCNDNDGKNNGKSGCVDDTLESIKDMAKDKAGNETQCKNAPEVILNVNSMDSRYHTTNANVIVNINAASDTKYELSTTECSNKDYAQMSNQGSNGANNINNYPVHTFYDGTINDIYATVTDETGNTTCTKINYKVYDRCTSKVTNGTPTYGACSASCGSGTRTQTQAMKDAYLPNTVCSSVSSTVSCGPLPSCCTGPTITRETVKDCPVCYGTARESDGVVNLDMSNRPSKEIKITIVECNGTQHVDYDYESCDSTPHCFSKTTEKDCDKCGIGTCKLTSKYDKSKSISFKYSNTQCAKNKCYVGNTLSPTGHPTTKNGTTISPKISAKGCENKGGTADAYWFYCTDSKGKLWTRLKGNGNGYRNPPQFACANNNISSYKSGKTITIDGKKYTVIHDSKTFWKKCTNMDVYK